MEGSDAATSCVTTGDRTESTAEVGAGMGEWEERRERIGWEGGVL